MKMIKLTALAVFIYCLGLHSRAEVGTLTVGTSVPGGHNIKKGVPLAPLVARDQIGGTVEGGRHADAQASFGPITNPDQGTFLLAGVNLRKNTNDFPMGVKQSATDVRLLQTLMPQNLYDGTIWEFWNIYSGTNETFGIPDVKIIAASSDVASATSSNILGEEITFSNLNNYGPSAVGWDGTKEITSGSGSQQVNKFTMAVGFRHFNVAVDADRQEVIDYLNAFKWWHITMQVFLKGSLVKTVVLYKAPPMLQLTYNGTNSVLTAVANGDAISYSLEYAARLEPGLAWTPWNKEISGGQSVTNFADLPTYFVRYSAPAP